MYAVRLFRGRVRSPVLNIRKNTLLSAFETLLEELSKELSDKKTEPWRKANIVNVNLRHIIVKWRRGAKGKPFLPVRPSVTNYGTRFYQVVIYRDRYFPEFTCYKKTLKEALQTLIAEVQRPKEKKWIKATLSDLSEQCAILVWKSDGGEPYMPQLT